MNNSDATIESLDELVRKLQEKASDLEIIAAMEKVYQNHQKDERSRT
jgi:hypothetical protein